MILFECIVHSLCYFNEKELEMRHERHIVEIDRKHVALQAYEYITPAIQFCISQQLFKRAHMNILLLDGRIPYQGESLEEMMSDDVGVVLGEFNVGFPGDWQHNYQGISRSKAYMTWRTGLPSGDILPHLREDGDTIYSGSAIVKKTIAACSGVQPYFDEMVSVWLAIAYNALIRDAFEKAEDDFINK